MKFGESLSEGLVPEWKAQYVNYKAGKKLIKKIDQLKADNESVISERSEIVSGPVDGSRVGKPTSDRTPLLGPIEEDPLSPQQNEELEPIGPPGKAIEHGLSVPKQRGSKQAEISSTNADPESSTSSAFNPRKNARRPSIFNYSLRSNTKDKQQNDFDIGKEQFLEFANSELSKVDKFYLEKELEAYERFLLLQDQLYQLREHKLEILKSRINQAGNKVTNIPNPDTVYTVNDIARHTKGVIAALNRFELPSLPSTTFLKKWRRHPRNIDDDISLTKKEDGLEFDVGYDQNRIRNGEAVFGDIDGEGVEETSSYDSDGIQHSTSEGNHIPSQDHPMFLSSTSSAHGGESISEANRRNRNREYAPKKVEFHVPYLYARKQLKTALLEHYRALSLLKSYRVLNRTALRKITKKFDKASGTSINGKFMEKVDKSYFQTSDLIDKLFSQVEELFLVFFDPDTTDRKQSLEKLKSISYTMNNIENRQPNYYLEFFSSGLFLGFGFPLMVLGLYLAVSGTLAGKIPEGRFLLQIWGGFFIMTIVFLLFGINLMVFDRFKINYKFIFEFNLASALNYKQFFLLPSFAFALFSILMWFSFNNFWPAQFPGRDWPWIYFGVMLVIFLWPGNHFYGSSRKWLQIALWRLLLSGFYPVEFRDFFLGDIFCSLTYTMGNISFFFCLYSHHWNGVLHDGTPVDNVCGSSKSRSMGFFSTLPSVWRLLQCIRRYMDTGDWFPHLANMLKYSISAIYYILLSVYRIDNTTTHRVVFIVFAIINSLYSATWDIVMDWSLLQSGSKNYLLRDNLFFKKPYYYYIAAILDIILRFQWIFYACFAKQIQQSAVTSFCVALAEIIRRFIWIFFRMENEHCTNVILFRASRDSPLPYPMKSKVERAIKKLVRLRYDNNKEIHSDINVNPPEGSSITTAYSQFPIDEQQHKSKHHDVEADLGTLKIPETESVRRRKSTFMNFSNVLNKAHIKDFQRRKTRVSVEHDSDDEDEDDLSDTSSVNSKNKPKSQTSHENE
ncbi:protein Syg1p [[Candida] anglica]|uniref:Protein Syg1p n=1 Tax=[Candida] anglica TaxID=148631 RepID=A0ABP0EI37_9ASCO